MRLEYQLESSWPELAWMADCSGDRGLVRRGSRVETRADWFCEAVWDGPFDDGDFDLTDIVAGSGRRRRGDGIVFVPAGATTDRIQSISVSSEDDQDVGVGRAIVSNSMACLLASSGARLKPTYRRYQRDLQSIINGLTKYKKTIETSLGRCRLHYFHNVAWDGQRLSEVQKPFPSRDFSSFESYHDFLTSCMAAVTRNAADPRRTHALDLIGTMSSGY